MICGTNGQTEILKGYNQQWGLDAGQHHRRWNVYLNIPNEWVLGRDYSETELEPSLLTKECAPIKRRRASQRVQRGKTRK
ncbi:hypothetical protein BDR05DRAFT_969470 [Suillus weaverae]|nr:hypothetical protein BDR05DRAFT_969470 [Suillus weaverae]